MQKQRGLRTLIQERDFTALWSKLIEAFIVDVVHNLPFLSPFDVIVRLVHWVVHNPWPPLYGNLLVLDLVISTEKLLGAAAWSGPLVRWRLKTNHVHLGTQDKCPTLKAL